MQSHRAAGMSVTQPNPDVRTTATFPPIRNRDGICFWNVNLPPELHTEDCLDYLEYAFKNDKDRMILSTYDNEYKRQTWDEVRDLIRQNRLDLFMRVPSDLRQYRQYCAKLVREYGTVIEFVMQERLKWTDLKPRGKPFEYPGTQTSHT
jgi:hypothetical protein